MSAAGHVSGAHVPGGHVVVTGGTGFCGTALVQRLARALGASVAALDWLPPAAPLGGARFVRADVRHEAAVRRALRGPKGSSAPADTVFHLAAIPSIARAPEAEYTSINAGGTEVVCRVARELGVRRLVHVSSSTVYGVPPPARVPIPEDAPLQPGHPYSRSKRAAEDAVRAAARAGLEAVILRPRVVVGPGRAGVFGLLFQLVAAGLPVPLLGGGRNRFQFTAVDDLVDACLLAARAPARPGRASVYNIGSDVRRPLRAEVEELIAHAGSRSRVVWAPSPSGSSPSSRALAVALGLGHALGLSPLVPEQYQVFAADFVLDTRRARRVLGFRPRHANGDGLRQAYDAWRASGGRPGLAALRRAWRARSQNATQLRLGQEPLGRDL